jgi:hypothetical protein
MIFLSVVQNKCNTELVVFMDKMDDSKRKKYGQSGGKSGVKAKKEKRKKET